MKFGKNILIYATADLLGRGIGFITSPFTTRLLTPEQYGVVPLLMAVWTTISLIQYGGMDWSYPFFRSQKSDELSKKEIMITSTYIATFSLLLVWAAFAIFGLFFPWLQNYANVKRIELLLFLLGLIPSALTGWYLFIKIFTSCIFLCSNYHTWKICWCCSSYTSYDNLCSRKSTYCLAYMYRICKCFSNYFVYK